MAEVLLFHHALGLTPGVHAFADSLRAGRAHRAHARPLRRPDLRRRRSPASATPRRSGSRRCTPAGTARPPTCPPRGVRRVLARRGVGPAARPDPGGRRRGVLMESCVPATEFGERWPAGVPVQVHGLDGDEFFVGDGDIDHARAIVAEADRGELFLYPGDGHLFADPALRELRRRGRGAAARAGARVPRLGRLSPALPAPQVWRVTPDTFRLRGRSDAPGAPDLPRRHPDEAEPLSRRCSRSSGPRRRRAGRR